MLRAAAAHQGTAFVEIYQNCPVFNDGAFDALTEKDGARRNQIRLEHGEPIRFGAGGRARRRARGPTAASRSSTWPTSARTRCSSTTPTATDPSLAFALAHLAERPTGPTPIGVFRAVEHPLYGAAAALNADRAVGGLDELEALLHAGDTWTVA